MIGPNDSNADDDHIDMRACLWEKLGPARCRWQHLHSYNTKIPLYIIMHAIKFRMIETSPHISIYGLTIFLVHLFRNNIIVREALEELKL